MLSIALAPLAAISLFAASLPMLGGLRQRRAHAVRRPRSSATALELVTSEVDEFLEVAVRSRSQGVHTLTLTVSIYSATNQECARFEVPGRLLLPGRATHEHIDLHGLADGRYQAVVIADFGGARFAARYAWTHTSRPAGLAVAA